MQNVLRLLARNRPSNCPPQRKVSVVARSLGAIFGNKAGGDEISAIPYAGRDLPLLMLRSGVAISGRSGYGITSGGVLPLVDSLFNAYRGKLDMGAFIWDASGETLPYLLFALHRAGRNVIHDVTVMTPKHGLVLVELVEESTGNRFFLSSKGSMYSPSGFAELLEATVDNSLGSHRISAGVVESCSDQVWMNSVLPELRGLKFTPIAGKTNFLGWRLTPDGRLARLDKIVDLDTANMVGAADGKSVSIKFPGQLKFVDRYFLDDGIHRNLIDPSIPDVETVEYLARLVPADDPIHGNIERFSYFKRTLLNLIALFRESYPTEHLAVDDVLRLLTNESALALEVHRLARDREKPADGSPATDDQASRGSLSAARRAAVIDFFAREWFTLDHLTKSETLRAAKASFSKLSSDPALHTKFCAESTVDFNRCFNAGEIIAVSGSADPGWVDIGRAMHAHFGKAMCSRSNQPSADRERVVLNLNIDAPIYLPELKKLNTLARQLRLINVLVTREYAQTSQVIPVTNTPPAIDQSYKEFGTHVFFHSCNPKMAEFTKTVLPENHPLKKFPASELAQNEVILATTKVDGTAIKANVVSSPITGPDMKDEFLNFLRRYEHARIEAILARTNRSSFLDHTPVAASRFH